MTRRILLIALAVLALVASGCEKKHVAKEDTTDDGPAIEIQRNPCSDTMEPLGSGKSINGRSGQAVNGKIAATDWQYYLWCEGGNNALKYYDNGLFSASWSNTMNSLGGVGYFYGSPGESPDGKQYDAYFKHSKTGSAGSYSYIGIYGWTLNPLTEFYIIEDWYTKPGSAVGQKKGSSTVDGATYDIYQNTRVNVPSIDGTATFPQYFAVRSSPRQCGHINISEHFENFEKLGMHLGKLYDLLYLVEVGGGTGTFNCTYFYMSDGGSN
ncbi:MAG: glycoside hydrolase family 11 protein [Bacteroidales bacterium]|nr:glycoside hydrolase family 11 protein [Bacteroidales bacterium]